MSNPLWNLMATKDPDAFSKGSSLEEVTWWVSDYIDAKDTTIATLKAEVIEANKLLASTQYQALQIAGERDNLKAEVERLKELLYRQIEIDFTSEE